MKNRRPWILLPLLVLVTAVAAVNYLVSEKKSATSNQAAVVHEKSSFQGAERPRIKTPNFKLKDEDGREVSLKGQRGKVVAVTFLYSTCKETCPLQAQLLRGALDDLGQKERSVVALAVSVKPEVDSRTSVKTFLTKQHVLGRMRYLVGPSERLKAVWKAFAIQPQSQDLEHSSYIVLLDKRGRQAVGHPYSQTNSEMIAHDMRVLIRES